MVAALWSEHVLHRDSAAGLRHATALPAHVLAETYSTLTSLRMRPSVTLTALRSLDLKALPLPPSAYLTVIARAADAGITGGAIHDAVVAATAKHHRYRLLSADRRAVRTYQTIGVDYEIIG